MPTLRQEKKEAVEIVYHGYIFDHFLIQGSDTKKSQSITTTNNNHDFRKLVLKKEAFLSQLILTLK